MAATTLDRALVRHWPSGGLLKQSLESPEDAVPNDMKMKAYASFAEYLAGQSPRNRNVIRALRTFVKRIAPQLQESVKWGNGCWVQGKAPVAYVYSAADHVQFGFFAGSTLKDPNGLLRARAGSCGTSRSAGGPTSMRARSRPSSSRRSGTAFVSGADPSTGCLAAATRRGVHVRYPRGQEPGCS